jgi:hypothetical protein
MARVRACGCLLCAYADTVRSVCVYLVYVIWHKMPGPCATDYTALLAALLDPFEVVDKEAQETNEGSNINSNSDKSTVDRLQTLLVPRSMAKR